MPFYQSGELIKYESITELYDRSLTVYGIKIVAGAEVSGNKAVPDDWVYKTAKVIQLLLDPEGQGIDSVAQENAIKILEGQVVLSTQVYLLFKEHFTAVGTAMNLTHCVRQIYGKAWMNTTISMLVTIWSGTEISNPRIPPQVEMI